MDVRRLSILALTLVACAQGNLEPGTSFNPTVGGTQPSDTGNDDGDGDDDGDSGEASGSTGGSATADEGSSGPAPTTNEGDSTTDPTDASAEGESTTEPMPGDTSTTEPMNDDGIDTEPGMLPDAGPYEDCSLPDCEAGNDCLGIVGLDDYAPFCSPQCTSDADCPPGGTAVPSCILSEEGAADPTNCVLLCSYDNESLGNCPNGMTCADIPGQTTQVGVCMW